MARRRFFVESTEKGFAELKGPSAEHLSRVLRAEVGQRYEISDNRAVYLGEIDEIRRDRVLFRLLERLETEEAQLRLTLLACLFKFSRFEWMIEKATELGVETIVPVVSALSEKGLAQAATKRLTRWRRIGLEGSQQSRRAQVPVITSPIPFEEAVKKPDSYRYLLEETGSAAPILASIPSDTRLSSTDSVCLLVGPEGGWTDDERASSRSQGWLPVSLGPQILRAETAALAAMAVLANAWYASPGMQKGPSRSETAKGL